MTRASKAGVAVVLLLLALIASGWLFPVEDGGSSIVNGEECFAVTGEGSFLSPVVLQDPVAVLDEVESSLAALPSEDVAGLAAEVELPTDAVNIHWDEENGVFGFEIKGAAEQVLASLNERWNAQGWEGMPLGDMCGATLVKSSGAYRWMVVAITQVGSAACVVGRVM